MKIKVGDLQPILNDWVVQVVYPKSTSWQIFGLSFVMSMASNQIAAMIEQWAGYATDKNGDLDLDKMHEAASKALESTGGKVEIPYLQWLFDKDDLEKLFEIAKRRGK